MKFYNFTWSVIIFFYPVPVYAQSFYGDTFGDVLHLVEDVFISKTASLYTKHIYADTSLQIYNNGSIYGDLFTCNGCDMRIHSNGEIIGRIHVAQDATLTQIIETPAQLRQLNVVGNYSVLINKTSNIAWRDIQYIAKSADKIILHNAVIDFSISDLQTTAHNSPQIELVGENEIHLHDLDEFNDVTIMNNITGDGTIRLNTNVPNKLYAASATIDNDTLHIHKIRETDYYKILGTDIGQYLNSLRLSNSSDKLIARLDAAHTMDELHHIIHKSVRLNPRQLIQPLATIAQHRRAAATTDYYSNGLNIATSHIEPFYLSGDNISAYGANIDVVTPISKYVLGGINTFIGQVNFNDRTDTINGTVYGIGAFAQYTNSAFYSMTQIGHITGNFITPEIYYAGKTFYNPNANISYTTIDIGPHIVNTSNLLITATLGGEMEYSSITDHNEFKSALRGGILSNMTHHGVDLVYNYFTHMSLTTNSVTQISIGVSIMSEPDNVAGNIAISHVNENGAPSYHVRAGLKFGF
ncbi:hypothetical protein HDR61_02755 [bacterium]|nr:hypothetical protein [bacterium]